MKFEFGLLPNSNSTQENPIKPEKSKSLIYHNLNICFYKWVKLVENSEEG
jgi:hypothetical protein